MGKTEFSASFVNRIVDILLERLDHDNDTLFDRSKVLQKQLWLVLSWLTLKPLQPVLLPLLRW